VLWYEFIYFIYKMKHVLRWSFEIYKPTGIFKLVRTCKQLKSPNKYLRILSDIFSEMKANDQTEVIKII